MSTPYDLAIEDLKQKILAKEAQLHAELLPLKAAANTLCKLAEIEELYSLGDIATPGSKKQIRIEEGQFFSKPLAGSVAVIMESRDALGLPRPTSIDEIYDALVLGNYKFEGATGSPENSKRALKISLTKNTTQFCKIGEKFALRKWYQVRTARKSKAGDAEQPDDSPSFEDPPTQAEQIFSGEADLHKNASE